MRGDMRIYGGSEEMRGGKRSEEIGGDGMRCEEIGRDLAGFDEIS